MTTQHAAPLLCAGLIGYRAYRMAGAGQRIGLYGFGAAAHIIAQVAVHQGREILAFVTPGDDQARRLRASWVQSGPDGPTRHRPRRSTLPSSSPRSAHCFRKRYGTRHGGTVVCAGIHMSDIPSFPYRILWEERVVRSVANLTREDARDFLAVAGTTPIRTHVQPYPLADANRALGDLRAGRLSGAAVLVP